MKREEMSKPKPPAAPRDRQSQRKHLPVVVKGEHPIRKEKAAAEKRALGKRLKGQKADDAADKMIRAEKGNAGKPARDKARRPRKTVKAASSKSR